jgi:MFS transporter, FSR family, fosmidomycin resistance protein
MTAHERNVLITTCMGHFLSHFNMLTFPAVVLPLATRLNLPMAQVLGMSFWMYLLFGLSAMPWGFAADRFGAKYLMGIYYAGAGLCGLAAAFWIDSPGAMVLSLAGLGLFSGIYHPAGLGLISTQIKRVSYGMGINGMFGNLGLASAPLVAGVVTWLWGPRAAYLVLGGANLVGLIVMAVLPLPLAAHETSKTAESNGGRGFFILLIAMMLGGIAYRGASVILPAYFELRNQGIFHWLTQHIPAGFSTNLVATMIASAIFLVGMVAQYMGGRVAERYSLQHSYLVFHLIAIPAAFAMGWATDLPLVALALVYFFFMLGMQPIENTLVSRLTPQRWRHSAYGMKFILTFGVGALAVKGVQAVESGFGITRVYPALGCVSIVLVMTIGVLIVRMRPDAQQAVARPAAMESDPCAPLNP